MKIAQDMLVLAILLMGPQVTEASMGWSISKKTSHACFNRHLTSLTMVRGGSTASAEPLEEEPIDTMIMQELTQPIDDRSDTYRSEIRSEFARIRQQLMESEDENEDWSESENENEITPTAIVEEATIEMEVVETTYNQATEESNPMSVETKTPSKWLKLEPMATQEPKTNKEDTAEPSSKNHDKTSTLLKTKRRAFLSASEVASDSCHPRPSIKVTDRAMEQSLSFVQHKKKALVNGISNQLKSVESASIKAADRAMEHSLSFVQQKKKAFVKGLSKQLKSVESTSIKAADKALEQSLSFVQQQKKAFVKGISNHLKSVESITDETIKTALVVLCSLLLTLAMKVSFNILQVDPFDSLAGLL
jgi:hypothetical protein